MAEETPRFRELLREAQDADLSDVAAQGLIYQGGARWRAAAGGGESPRRGAPPAMLTPPAAWGPGDAPDGLPIVVFVPSRLQAADGDGLHRALLFFVKIMEPISRDGFHVVFCYSDVSWFSQGCALQRGVRSGTGYSGATRPRRVPVLIPPRGSHFAYLRGVHGALPRAFRKNIKSLHILHPTATLRAFFFFLRPLVKRKFWRKLQYHAAVQSVRNAGPLARSGG